MCVGGKSLFNKLIFIYRRLKLDLSLSPCHILNSKQIKVIIRHKITPETNREYTGSYRHGNNFINPTLIAQQLRKRINKWDCMKLHSFCTAKERVTRLKRQSMEWKKIFSSYKSDKELTTRIYRLLKKLILQRINNPLSNWANVLNGQVAKEDVQMANKYEERLNILGHKRNSSQNNIEISPNSSQNGYHQ
jgi:hypothetical protein